MKKIKATSISLLSILILCSITNISTAAPPSYVGINSGDSFSWDIKMYFSNLVKYQEDLGFNLTEELGMPVEMFSTDPSIKIKAAVENCSDMTTAPNGVEGSIVYATMTISILDIPLFSSAAPFFILDSSTPNLFNESMNFLIMAMDVGGPLTLLFVANDVNWTSVVAELGTMTAMFPGLSGNLTVTAQTDGLTLTVLEGALNVSQKAIGFTLSYTSAGVLSKAELSYDNAPLLSMVLTSSEDEIPGYDILIILGLSTVASIGLIYAVKRKNRIIS